MKHINEYLVHRDIKPENILNFDSSYNTYICCGEFIIQTTIYPKNQKIIIEYE